MRRRVELEDPVAEAAQTPDEPWDPERWAEDDPDSMWVPFVERSSRWGDV